MVKFSLFLIPVLLVGCAGPGKYLLNTWRVDEVEFLDSLNTLTVLQKKNISQNLQSSVRFTFSPDSSFRVQQDTVFINGRWWLSRDGKKLHTEINQQVTEADIYLLNKDRLRFLSNGDMNQTFIFNCVPVIATNTK